ncbi:hypothetical protein ATCCBAA256_17740 [Mycobacterium montefiorense]|nr:hypothetical protein ATCCBAA256_17740 [Mycobacterium montefiorense]
MRRALQRGASPRKTPADTNTNTMSVIANSLLQRCLDRSERVRATGRQQPGGGDVGRASLMAFGDYLQFQAEDQNWLRREY